jgi:peroxiredoxin
VELEALAEKTSEIEQLGASLVLIAPQLETHNRTIKEEKGLKADILSDPGNEVAERYGIRFKLPDDLKEIYRQFKINLDEYNGDDSWTLPLPTRLIIDKDGVIRYAEMDADYTVRPDPEETIAALKEIV